MKARILVIEDEMAINDLLCMNLEAAGYETVGYLDGNDASEGVAQDHEFQCALVDIMLPGKDGYTLLPELKKFGIPVIFLTAKADVTSKVKGLKDGAEDYIVKPFDLDEVFARVTVQLRQSVEKQPMEIEKTENLPQNLKNIQFDTESFEIKNSQETIRLAKKECLILQTLLKHPKKIFTKEELYELVWEDSYLPGDNTLNTHLSNLRKKLNQLDPNQEYIETIWGVGVRLKGDKQ